MGAVGICCYSEIVTAPDNTAVASGRIFLLLLRIPGRCDVLFSGPVERRHERPFRVQSLQSTLSSGLSRHDFAREP